MAIRPSMIAVLLLSPALLAQERTVALDPRTTEIHFTLGATLHTVEGSVRLREGEIRFDAQTRTVSGRVVIDARSAETGNDRRDRKMHREVLESDRFPEIVFEPERIEGTLRTPGSSDVTLEGVLRIHGSAHPVSLPLEVEIRADAVKATGRLRVPYVQWGLEDPSVFVLRVDKYVDVNLEAEGRILETAGGP